MEVILLEKVYKLGDLGDQIRVKPGYGRNYLIPQGKAVPATKANIEEFQQRREKLERAQAEILQSAQSKAEKLDGQVFVIKRRAGSEGKLFGSVSAADVEAAIAETGFDVGKSRIQLADGPIRTTGEFDLAVQLHADVSVGIKIVVEAEEDGKSTSSASSE